MRPASACPRAMRVSASPEAITCASTNTGRPEASWPSALNRSISPASSGSFSSE